MNITLRALDCFPLKRYIRNVTGVNKNKKENNLEIFPEIELIYYTTI